MTHPDITVEQHSALSGVIHQAGMEGIEARIKIQEGHTQAAKVDVYANLIQPQAKGIHMSRLYLEVISSLSQNVLSEEMLHGLLERLIETHKDLSSEVGLRIHAPILIERQALVSEHRGVRHYPVKIWASLSKTTGIQLETYVEVLYSATCPCSAALSRQLVAENFKAQHQHLDQVSTDAIVRWLSDEKNNVATPHAQRSLARVWVRGFYKDFDELISRIEKALKTPVQAAVKRSDEQEFARANAANLMFAEDAARRIHHALKNHVSASQVKVEHFESLHPHNAVAQMGGEVGEEGWRC